MKRALKVKLAGIFMIFLFLGSMAIVIYNIYRP